MSRDGSRLGDTTGYASETQILWRRSSPTYHSIEQFEDFENEEECELEDGAPAYALPCAVQTYRTGGPGFMDEDKLLRFQLSSVGTLLADLAGSHEIKAGADFELNKYGHVRGYSGNRYVSQFRSGTGFYDRRQYGFLTGPDEFTLMEQLETDTKSLSIGGFLQDSWEILVDMLTVNFGARYDAQYIYGGQGNLALAMPNQWSPRVGAIFDPTEEGRSKIFANFAIFYEGVPLDIADRSGSGEPSAYGYYAAQNDPHVDEIGNDGYCDPRETDPDSPDACFDREQGISFAGPSDVNRIYTHHNGRTPVDPDLKPQSSSELMLGAEYALFDMIRLGATYTRRWMNNVIEDMSRDEAQTYFIGNPGDGIASDFPKAVRDYNAFTLYAMKAMGDNWLAQVSYTLAWLEGNYAGLFRPETGQLDPNINSDFDLRSLLVNRDGPLPGDHRHNIKVFTAYDFAISETHQVNAGLGFRTRSGGPTNTLGGHVIYGSDEVFILPRGSGERLPWVHNVDVQVGYLLKFDEAYSIGLTIEVFNLFNFQEVTRIDETYTLSGVLPIEGGTKDDLDDIQHADGTDFDPDTEVNPNFGNPERYQRPLTCRIGLRATF